ncbi:MAG: hypothetical protein JKY94_16170 [Rhodobacteraceae bacterium]|nr:hypothetical protein [Paracoccaceae bacterium]
MSRIRKIATTVGTVACAIGIGYFVQRGETTPVAAVEVIQATVVKPMIGPVAEPDAPLDIQGITLTSAMPETPTPRRLVEPEPDLSNAACAVTASATVAPMASVDLIVLAPCFRNDRVTIHHNGMVFTEATDITGTLMMTLPALIDNAVFVVAFANGKGAVAMAQIPDLADYRRVVLQWSGQSVFQIHAREFGADYGTPGHIWIGMDESVSPDQHGSIVRLGNLDALAPYLAEVYTFPRSMSERSGIVSMSIETEVTADNCGREVVAQTIELGLGQQLRTRDLVLSVPECTAIGDFLVLNNLVDDMKIAAN